MLYFSTVVPLLESTLKTLMQADVFNDFRLVGGTSLSLQLGHRMSDDIDLFTDANYGSIDFGQIDTFLRDTFPYVGTSKIKQVGLGTCYYIGNSDSDLVKIDLFYTDPFIRDKVVIDGIRMANVEDVIAMKIEVVQHGGRKKDFWDLHELFAKHTLDGMIAVHEERYPYGHDAELILNNFTNFEKAENAFNPDCLRGKHWEVIKAEITELLQEYRRDN